MAVAYLIIPVQPALQTMPAFCGRPGGLPFTLASLGFPTGPTLPTIPTVPTAVRRSKGIPLPAGKSPASGSAPLPLPLLLLPAGLGVTPPAAVTPPVTLGDVTPRAVRDSVTASRCVSALARGAPGNINNNDPLSGWMEQKLSSAAWEYPLLPAADLEPGSAAEDAGIPDDLQDLLLDGADSVAVPALPGDAANTLLEELISGSVRENPQLFGGVELDGLESCSLDGVQWVEEQGPAGVASPPLLLCQSPAGFSLSPGPQQQVPFESWVPTLCPSPGEGPVSPASECSADLAPGPDWQPNPAARRRAARPRPYDKETVRPGVRRQPLSEEERRERKKEQNKNAATRYRQKKKEEHDLVSCDQDVLESRNKQLRERVGALGRELNYLKQLMREVLRHKRVGV